MRRLRVLAGIILLLPLGIFASTPTGTLVGTIVDSTGAVVVNAAVAVVEVRTHARRTATSNSRGDYTVALLPPGIYHVSVAAGALRGTAAREVRVDVDEIVRVDVVLHVQIHQQVAITASVPLVQADTSSLGQVVQETTARSLPLNERNFLTFALLGSGVQPGADGSENSALSLAVSVNGAREQSNNFLLDGVDNNDITLNHYFVMPSVEAISEFKVQSSTAPAEFGRSGGAQINIVLKSGTNSFHGSLFEYFRNRTLDAKNFFDLPHCRATSVVGTCGEIPRYDRNQFGGSLGGPIRRNHTFFFFSYEGLRLRQAVTRRATVPSQQQRAAAVAAVIPGDRNPSGVAVLNLLPAANVGPNLAGSNLFFSAPLLRQGTNSFVGKLDHYMAGGDNLSFHYALTDLDRFTPVDPLFPFTNLPGYGGSFVNRGHNLGLSWTHAFSGRILNEFRVGFNRVSGVLFQESSGTNRAAELGFPVVFSDPAHLGYPQVGIAGFDGIGEPFNLPQVRIGNTFHFSDGLVIQPGFQEGRHRIKLGADIRRVQLDRVLDLFSRGRWVFLGGFSGNPLIDLLRGTPDFALAPKGDTHLAQRTTSVNLYVQDDFRIHPRLTVNLGLRWEYNDPPVDIHDRLSVPDLSTASATCTPKPDCQFLVVGTRGVSRGVYSPDHNNFAVRIGLGWRPWHSERFVVHAGYGIFYDLPPLELNIFPRFNPPFFQVLVFPNYGTNTIQDILAQPPALTPPLVRAIDSGIRTPYVEQWNLGLQYEALRETVVEIFYVGSSGKKLALQRDINQTLPATGLPPYPQFGPIDTIFTAGSSSYQSLQLGVERHLRRGFFLLASYTWSKSLDDASSLIGAATEPGIAQNSADLRSEWGLSATDIRQRLVGSLVWHLPLGRGQRWIKAQGWAQRFMGDWQLGSIIALQSGRPFTINRGIDQSHSGTVNLGVFPDRPDQIADPFLAGPVATNPDPLCHATISQGGKAADAVHAVATWFNPCAFADPGSGRFGSAGRNSLVGPGLQQIDLSIAKQIRLGAENRLLQLRAEFFNLFNHPNFDTPDRIFDSATFGRLNSANAFGNRPPRQIQMGVRYAF